VVGVKGWGVLLGAGLALYNAVVFLVYAWDKHRARRGQWRVPERTLLWLAALGGGLGALVGVYGIRHKVRKPRFAVGVPVLLAVQVGLAAWAALR